MEIDEKPDEFRRVLTLDGVSDYDYSNYGSDLELDYETSSEDPDYFETFDDISLDNVFLARIDCYK